MKPIIFILLIYMFLVFSCSTKIELDIPYSPPQIVINSLITTDSLITVSIHKTTPMLSEGIGIVNNAKVELWAGGSFVENLQQKENGTYQSEMVAQIGINYQIYIDVSGFDRISSSAIIPEPVNITQASINVDSYYDQQQMQQVSEVEISFYDPPQINNFYQVSFYSYSDYYEGYWDADNTFIITDTTRSYNGNYYLNSKDPIIVNEGDIQYYHGTGHIRSLVFSDELLDEKTSIKFLMGMTVGEFAKPVVILRNIGHEYYLFQKSWIRQAFNQGIGSFDATNMFLVSNPNELYSNIENGLGIFAGYSEIHFEPEEIE